MNSISPEILIIFSLILVAIAFLYASVGHGGASGYLALMALFSFPIAFMKPAALLLNLFVAGISFWYFKKNKYFSWQLFYPFAITSIPSAFIGGYLDVDPTLYKQILGFFLAIAILRMTGFVGGKKEYRTKVNFPIALFIGMIIGLLSGMIGIGGGIILSPIIILLAWGDMKEAAAVSALFIFMNSAAGMAGFIMKNNTFPEKAFILVPLALTGGMLGAMYGSKKFTNQTLSYILSFVLIMASIKLFII